MSDCISDCSKPGDWAGDKTPDAMKPLAQRAADLFSEKPYKHKVKYDYYERWQNCSCGERVDTHKKNNGNCPIPDPIDITDPGKALVKFIEIWATSNEDSLAVIIQSVMVPKLKRQPQINFTNYHIHKALKEATAEQIWEICCLAKESKGK